MSPTSGCRTTAKVRCTLAASEPRRCAQANCDQVLHDQASRALEVVAIAEAADGRWAAFEIKLGTGQIEAGAGTLLKFANRVDIAKRARPSLLAVLVGNGYGYLREDGIAVIPVGALGAVGAAPRQRRQKAKERR